MTADKSFHFSQGSGPILVSMPHVGTNIPAEIADSLTAEARRMTDTDWHVDRLYNFLRDMNVSILKADYSRIVIDLNRDAAGKPLYPGQSETELCPTTGFDGLPLYQPGHAPDQAEISKRRENYWQPYHDKIRQELDRIKAHFGYAILWDAHSIQSQVPRFFEGQLPDLNLGTGNGTSCRPSLAHDLRDIAAASSYSVILNGRFKGGYITRHYGKPGNNVHAIQMEISQITYMDEAPTFKFRTDKAEKLRPTLKALFTYLQNFRP